MFGVCFSVLHFWAEYRYIKIHNQNNVMHNVWYNSGKMHSRTIFCKVSSFWKLNRWFPCRYNINFWNPENDNIIYFCYLTKWNDSRNNDFAECTDVIMLWICIKNVVYVTSTSFLTNSLGILVWILTYSTTFEWIY